MMKHFYLKFILGCLLCLLSTQVFSQLAAQPWYIETIVHNGDYGEANHDLTGYVTYRVYIQFANPDNYLTTIFAAESPADCIQDVDSTVHFEFPCGLFQHELGAAYGFNESCLYNIPIIPTSEFDSFLTIGQECASPAVPTCDNLGTVGLCSTWVDNFEGTATAGIYDGTTFFWDEAAIYAAPCFSPFPQSVSHADANSRVLIGQFTSCGPMSGCVNITYTDQNLVDHTEFNICFEAEMPCLANAMDTIPSITLAGCAGSAAQVVLDGGGNGPIDYQLYTDADVAVGAPYLNIGTPLTITPIAAGDYYITMQDELGCIDSTAVFTVSEPEVLTFDATRLTDVLCFGETTGSIQLECSGGTGSVTVTMNGTQTFDCGDTVSNLGCGTYTFVAVDDNNCSQTETIQISCPAQIVYNPVVTVIDCFGDDDGSIVGNVTGGTGTLVADWTYNTDPFGSQITGPSPLNVSISNLDGGTYAIHIEDENNCSVNQTFQITEPTQLVVDLPSTDVSCFGLCDGSIAPEISGGTNPVTTAITLVGGGPVNINALCAGEYALLFTDDNNCTVQDTVEIVQPTDITYTLDVQDVSCFGLCDAQISITEVSGSFGNFTYELTPNSANCQAPCSGNEAIYTEVCAGTYDVVITDESGCPKNINDIVVATPAQIGLILTPTDVTCYGLSDGEILVETVGGTAPIVITPSDSIAPAVLGGFAIGTYTITITDANGCSTEGDVIIEQPDSLYGNVLNVVDASCGGQCDGSVSYEVFGGTIPYDYALLPTTRTGPVNGLITSLCALEYQLVVSDLFNCTDTLEFEVIEPTPLEITTLLNAPTCTGMFDGSAEIQISGGTGDLTLFIEPADTDVLEIDSVTFSLSGLGEGELYLELNDENNCAILDTVLIVPDIITDMVLTTFSTPETCWNEVDGTATVAVQNGFLPISYSWDDPQNQVTATASGLAPNQEYTVVVTDDIGCTLSASVFVDPTEGCFFISTAITPNGDGSNDTWILGGLEFYYDAKINVYNRWGQNVFSSKGYNSNWDGTYQGELLPVADYYFTIDYADDKDVIMGTVTIKY